MRKGRRNLATALKTRVRAGNPLAEFDALPAAARAWARGGGVAMVGAVDRADLGAGNAGGRRGAGSGAFGAGGGDDAGA